MKYTIKTTDTGCKQILELEDGKVFSCNYSKTFFGCEGDGPSLEAQLEEAGYDDLAERAGDVFDGIQVDDFLEMAELAE